MICNRDKLADQMLTFSTLLQTAGLSPQSVRLLRHQDNNFPRPTTAYSLWRDHRDVFEAYQQTQSFGNEPKLRAPYWATFVGLPDNETLFAGLYEAALEGPLLTDRPHPVSGPSERAGSSNMYRLTASNILAEYEGRLIIGWGEGYRSWIQRADGSPKPIIELRRTFREDDFPGFGSFLRRLSELESMPTGWRQLLAATRGIYLLTCPRTKEQYVGKASGTGGFLARWHEYEVTGHGGNVALRSRDASDYQVSILETVGSAATEADITAMETLWKLKLQSREMGLNRN